MITKATTGQTLAHLNKTSLVKILEMQLTLFPCVWTTNMLLFRGDEILFTTRSIHGSVKPPQHNLRLTSQNFLAVWGARLSSPHNFFYLKSAFQPFAWDWNRLLLVELFKLWWPWTRVLLRSKLLIIILVKKLTCENFKWYFNKRSDMWRTIYFTA